ncbi:NAD-dependent epimerase/dehydratase family protein [Streptomyces sp. NPDC004069]
MSALKKVVVTGGSGRVGRYVVAELARTFDVVNADRVASDASVAYAETDVMDLDRVRAVTKGADAVVHLAAIDFDWKAAPEEYIRVNTLGSWHVLQAAAENDVKKVVLTSSVSACGLSEMRPDWTPRYLAVDEDHENRPTQAYSVSKQIIETMGLSVVRSGGPDVICLRPLAVVLPETLAEFTAFIDDPATHWLYYYVTAQDVARAFRAALETDGLRYGTFFLSADDTCRPEPTLDWYRERIGALPEIRNPRLYQRNPRASIFSSTRARDLLGWEPTSDFPALRAEQGL